MNDLRAHMRQPQTLGPVVERVEVPQPTVENVIGVQDIVWNSYYDLANNFVEQFVTGALPSVDATIDTAKTSAIVAGKEVKRMPYLDDFAEMMRREDCDNHTRLERYVNPIGPAGGLDWFKASMLAVMIENGRVGIKETASGIRAVYIDRARAGNIFFRIFGGRMTLIIAVAQWFLFMGLFEVVASKKAEHVLLVIICSLFVLFLYNLTHWRFYKRYSFVLGVTLVDGWKARNMPTTFDAQWYRGRPAIHAVNLSLQAAGLIIAVLQFIKVSGWV